MSFAKRVRVPDSAPFSAGAIRGLNEALADSDEWQRAWLSGFLAACEGFDAVATPPTAAPRVPLSILYATESGNAESVAYALEKRAKASNFAPRTMDAADTTMAELADLVNLLVIASTWGEGDPPQRAERFCRELLGEGAPRLEGVRFGVLALGDSSYTQFCEVGHKLDRRLEDLGGNRVLECVDCDLDYEQPAADWSARALEKLAKLHEAERAVVEAPRLGDSPGAFSKKRPFSAEITQIVRLSGERSSKQTLHVELSLAGSGLAFEPGDAIAIAPQNDPEVVEEILEIAGLAGDTTTAARLRDEFDITTLTRRVAEAYGARLPGSKLDPLLEGGGFEAYRSERQIVDLLREFPHPLRPDELTGLFRRLPPRLYSVASSPRAEPEAVHLLLGVVRYEALGRVRSGVTTGWVADRRERGDALPIYVKSNPHFRLPRDSERPIIMIGPGTGVAPFRAFLQERRAAGAKGRNWLFFGERTFTHDFLYQLEWQELVAEGALHRMDVAFSRDQREKVYVQHRLWERRTEVFRWLEEGAHLYVCGDERAMAKDVHAALVRIVAEEGAKNPDAAASYLERLREQGRYQRDLY